MATLFDLDRFIEAQRDVIESVRQELALGKKCSHWMWFIFPQIAGLGRSPMAQRYAIGSVKEAKAYLDHPLLGQRLIECTHLVNQITNRTVHDIFGSPDDLKFRSSMTLFAEIAGAPALFESALAKHFGGAPDKATLNILSDL